MPAKKKAESLENESKRSKTAERDDDGDGGSDNEDSSGRGGEETTTDLKKLLLETPSSEAECEKWFERIADRILNGIELVAKGKVFRLVEIEFYYNDLPKGSGSVHPDTFTHGDPQQLNTTASWYFHKSGSNFKSGTYKGLDISFGVKGVYGGILLRSLEDVSTGAVVEGSCRLVDKLLETCGVKSIPDLVKHKDYNDDITIPGILHVRDGGLTKKRPISVSPRVGLTLKRYDDQKGHFIMKPYRFITMPKEVKKQRQTIVLYMHAVLGKSAADIAAATGAGKAHVQRYISDFEAAGSKTVASFKGKELKAEEMSHLYAAFLKEYKPR